MNKNIDELKEKIIYLKDDIKKNLVKLTSNSYTHLKKIYIKQHLKKFMDIIKNTENIQQKKLIGLEIQNFEKYLRHAHNNGKNNIQISNNSISIPDLDESVVKKQLEYGMYHPLQNFKEMVENICIKVGFSSIDGPDIELEKYNFTKLNINKYHPARDMQDTFYIKDKDLLLRSHTSSVQIRILEKYSPPLQCISCGNVYRVDDIDAQHTPMFYQLEGIFVDKNINFANLKGIILLILKEIFGEKIEVRFRPSYYPYTEPSAAVDIGCIRCNKKGCSTCKYSGWITVLGSGMIHRNVFHSIDYDYKTWKGFAFGMGINRLAMIYYNLPSISMFYENDISIWENIK